MTDSISKVREHYSASGLTDRIKAALAMIAPESQTLMIAQLTPLDQSIRGAGSIAKFKVRAVLRRR